MASQISTSSLSHADENISKREKLDNVSSHSGDSESEDEILREEVGDLQKVFSYL